MFLNGNGAVRPACAAATRTGREPQPGEAEGEGAAPPHWHSVRFDRLIGLHIAESQRHVRDVSTRHAHADTVVARARRHPHPGSVRFAARRVGTHTHVTHTVTHRRRDTRSRCSGAPGSRRPSI